MNFWMRRLRAALPWLLVAVLSSGTVLLVLLPAAWITPQFTKASGGHVNLVDPAGSLWNGSATLMLAAGSDTSSATLLPGRIEWHTAFWPLFTGRVQMTMLQSEAMPVPVTLDLQGEVRLAWSDWRSFGQEAFGQLTVTLNDASSRVSLVKPLGSYQVVIQAQGNSSTIDLSTLKGPLTLKGHGMVGGGVSSFNGTASAAPEARDNLAGLLNLLGRPSGPDTVALTFVH
jgi:general secretion pathway protein N